MSNSRLLEKIRDRYWLIGCLLLSLSLQLSFIAKSSIWHDEAYSLWLVRGDIPEIIQRTARDVHPPFYYILLDLWTKFFGTSATAARSLSTLAILGSIAVSFLLVRKLFGKQPARISALVLALAPFLVRYGQEARMYALVSFLLILATYLLVQAIDSSKRSYFYLYGLVMAVALYTHYYAIFMVVALWLYVIIVSFLHKSKERPLILNKHWWGANILTGLLFLPWLPVAYGQFTRVQGGFWIPEVGLATMPSTVANWLHYTSLSQWPLALRVGLFLLPIILLKLAFFKNPMQRRQISLVGLWAFLTPFIVFVLSIVSRPIYVDRYFVFSAVGFYISLVILWYMKPLNRYILARTLFFVFLIAVLISGVQNVYRQSDHPMAKIGEVVTTNARPGDAIIAGELYVFLDFTYYNHSPTTAQLYAPAGVSGYGETSLFYDQPQLLIADWQKVRPSSHQVWVIGKLGDKDYYQRIPDSWRLVSSTEAKDIVLYQFHTTD